METPLSDHKPIWAAIAFPAQTSPKPAEIVDCTIYVRESAVIRLVGEQQPARLEVKFKNCGSGTAKGTITIDAGENVDIQSGDALGYDLASGQETVKTLFIRLKPGRDQAVVSSIHTKYPSQADVFARREYVMPKYAVAADMPALAGLLKKSEKHAVKSDQQTVGEARFAIVGSALGLEVDVFDPQVTQTNAVWKTAPSGTQVELFCSLPRSAGIRQLMLDPKRKGDTLRLMQNGELMAEPKVPCTFELLAGSGYKVKAIVPLSLLGIDSDARELLLELAVVLTPTATNRDCFYALYKSESPYLYNARYAMFKVTEGDPVGQDK